MKKNIGPISLISYISLTLIFFIVKSRFNFPGTTWIWVFLLFTGVVQFCNNLYITKYPEICGSYNITSALSATVVPWIFIFGICCVCLTLIPGWLRVFSNTFGSSIANMTGLNDAINAIFESHKPRSESQGINETVNLLYANRSKFINEIDLSDYIETKDTVSWQSLEKVLLFMNIPTSEDINKKKELFGELYRILTLKEDAGYFAWFILIGSISILVSTNSLLLTSCSSAEFNF